MSRTVAAIEDAFGRAIQNAREQGWPGDVASLRQAKVSIATLTDRIAELEAYALEADQTVRFLDRTYGERLSEAEAERDAMEAKGLKAVAELGAKLRSRNAELAAAIALASREPGE